MKFLKIPGNPLHRTKTFIVRLINMLLRLGNMNFKRKMSVSLLGIIMVFIVGVILGAALLTGVIEYSSFDSPPDEIKLPKWEDGRFWTYSFKTPEIEDVVSRMVVASSTESEYNVGVSSRVDAQRHGVLNYNPMLGRVVKEDLGVYESGIPQSLFSFPLKRGKQWSFSMFGLTEFSAMVKDIRIADLPDGGTTVIVDIEAKSSGNQRILYTYDSKAKWVGYLTYESASSEPLIEMNLISYGKGFSGSVFFVRGVDLFDAEYTAPDAEIQNTLVFGHPQWGPFDSLIYYFEISTGSSSSGTLIIKDPTSPDEALRRLFGSNLFESSLGTIPSPSEELTTQVVLTGEVNLKLRIAGGIEYVWNI
jgi:hypothetical protein